MSRSTHRPLNRTSHSTFPTSTVLCLVTSGLIRLLLVNTRYRLKSLVCNSCSPPPLLYIYLNSAALANQTSGLHLSGTGNSGILGLSFPRVASIAPTLGKTFLENILSSLPEQDRMFAFKLGRDLFHNYSQNDAISSFTVGQLDPDVANDTTAFTYTPVSLAGTTEYDFWKLPLQALTVNSVAIPLSRSLVPGAKAPIAVLDTGTSMILGPSVDVEAFWASVGGETVTRKNPDTGLWEVQCERGVIVGFVLGESGSANEYVVHPGDINWATGANGSEWCMGGVQANDGVCSPKPFSLFLTNLQASRSSPGTGFSGMSFSV